MRREHTCRRSSASRWTMILLIATFALLIAKSAIAANDPGHDTLYVEEDGDSLLTGNLNISDELRVANLFYASHMHIVGNGTIFGAPSQPRIMGGPSQLYIDSTGNLYINTKGGTSGIVQMGDTGTEAIHLNVSGNQTIAHNLYLTNGGLVVGGTTRISSSGVGTLASGSTVGGSSICTAANGLCADGTGSGNGWTNTSTTVSLVDSTDDLNVANTLYVDSSASSVGIGIANPTSKLEILGGNLELSANNFLKWTSGATQYGAIRSDSAGELKLESLGGIKLYLDTNTNSANNFEVHGNEETSGTSNIHFVVEDTGDVGIGVTDPNQRLHVSGNINVSGGSRNIWIDGARVCTESNGLCDAVSANVSSSTTSTDTAIVRWDGTAGTTIQNSALTITDGGSLDGIANITTGSSFRIGTGGVLSGTQSFAIGFSPEARANYAVAIGANPRSLGIASVALGYNAYAGNSESIALGRDTNASGANGVAIGEGARAKHTDAIAIGNNANIEQMFGVRSVAIGPGANASYTDAIVVGYNAKGSQESVGIGTGADAGSIAVAIGSGAYAFTRSIAIGEDSSASGQMGLAIGRQANTTANYAHAIGYLAKSTYQDTFALGRSAVTTSTNQFVIGASSVNLNTQVFGTLNTTGNLYENNERVCTASNGLCGSGSGDVTGPGSSTDNAIARFDGTTGKILQNGAVTIDDTGNLAGVGSISTASDAFFIGSSASVAGQGSIAIGDSASSDGGLSVAIGQFSVADSESATAIGWGAWAQDIYGTALGSGAIAGLNGVGIGLATAGANATAIGSDTYAQGAYAIAIGFNANASHAHSVALGRGARTTTSNQFVIGNTTQNLNTQLHGTLNTTGNLYENNERVCTASNGLCAQPLSSAAGWTNSSTEVYLTDSSDNITTHQGSGTPTFFVDNTNGRVGIGISNPSEILEVSGGNFRVTDSSGNGPRIIPGSFSSSLQALDSGGGYNQLDLVANTMAFYVNGNDLGLYIDSTKKVGIGMESPGEALHVNGSINVTSGNDICIDGGGNCLSDAASVAGSNTQIQFNDGGNFGADANFTWDKTNDRLGIGTNSPDTPFHVVKGGEVSKTWSPFSSTTLLVEQGDNDANTDITIVTGTGGAKSQGAILFANESDQNLGQIQYDVLSNYLLFATSGSEQVRIDSTGQVGIGTSSPTQALDVNGSINVSGPGNIYYEGDLTGYGADLAELVHSVGMLEPGDVVVLDENRDEGVRLSDEPYDTAVAGIISTDPSHLLSAEEGDVPLALAGRVPVKASVENGPIKRGDLLTTSSTPGHAMRCVTRSECTGSILGKAMEPLSEGTGVITALVVLG